MKSELDTLMQERSLDALLVSGGTHENPCMYYLANGAKVGASTLAIKQRGREPVLIVVGMEREDSTQLGTTRTNIVMFLALCCRSKKHGARPNEPHLLMAPPPYARYSDSYQAHKIYFRRIGYRWPVHRGWRQPARGDTAHQTGSSAPPEPRSTSGSLAQPGHRRARARKPASAGPTHCGRLVQVDATGC